MKLTPMEVVQKQLEYYNKHDIDGFISTYSKDIMIFNHGEDLPFLIGLEELRERYTQRFSNPKLHANIANRMEIGNKVIDYEEVSGIKDGELSRVIAIYEVAENLIQKVWFIRE